jgi:hypothetical protein
VFAVIALPFVMVVFMSAFTAFPTFCFCNSGGFNDKGVSVWHIAPLALVQRADARLTIEH